MDLVFAGDMAWPSENVLDLAAAQGLLAGHAVVANLEGPVIAGSPEECAVSNEFKFNLYSHSSVAQTLAGVGVVACGLANNHISDYVGGLESSKQALAAQGIQSFGTRQKPWCRVKVGDREYILFGACSPLPEPLNAGPGDQALLFKPEDCLSALRRLRQEHPSACLVAYMHWGYELAKYPQPADREWARRAIDAGVDLVIGHHPHLVQGLERHGLGVIAYSLGNFVLPQVDYRGRKLKYKTDAVCEQLLLAHSAQSLRAHWLRYDLAEGALQVLDSSDAFTDPVLAEKTPFAGLDDEAYREWFRKEGQFGTELGRSSGPVFWSYRGFLGIDSRLKFSLLALRRLVRKWAIVSGLHKPYNW